MIYPVFVFRGLQDMWEQEKMAYANIVCEMREEARAKGETHTEYLAPCFEFIESDEEELQVLAAIAKRRQDLMAENQGVRIQVAVSFIAKQ